MENILDKTKKILKLRDYSSRIIKAYLFYIEEYLLFSRKRKFLK